MQVVGASGGGAAAAQGRGDAGAGASDAQLWLRRKETVGGEGKRGETRRSEERGTGTSSEWQRGGGDGGARRVGREGEGRRRCSIARRCKAAARRVESTVIECCKGVREEREKR